MLILDDWGLAKLGHQHRRDLLQITDDRDAARSTILASQIPVANWHDYLGDPTIADAIDDRLLHGAHRIVLKGPSRRKTQRTKGALHEILAIQNRRFAPTDYGGVISDHDAA